MGKKHLSYPISSEKGKIIKTPVPKAGINWNKEYPIFSFHFIDSKHCITKCDKAEKSSFVIKLKKISQLTWEELIKAPKHGLGCEPISISSIKVPIPKIITPDTKQVYAFRYYGKKAMIGHRIENKYYIIWFDSNFSVYTHG